MYVNDSRPREYVPYCGKRKSRKFVFAAVAAACILAALLFYFAGARYFGDYAGLQDVPTAVLTEENENTEGRE